MSQRILSVLIAGIPCGSLLQREDGRLQFSYDSDYEGIPLSLSMPIRNEPYGDKRVRPYLFGLLPDDQAVRRETGRRFGVSGNNPFDLLEHVGLDCPGAVQFCDPNSIELALSRSEKLKPLSGHDIATRLIQGKAAQATSWTDGQEHWSLGGQQSKFALRLENGAWNECLGAAATTHIFKPGIPRLALQALNEFVCMKLASACEIPAASVDYAVFEEEAAIVIARYDRTFDGDGRVIRLHQEDFCQTLGVLPENKYAENGGPHAADILHVLSGTKEFARQNIWRFTRALFFNYLIGAPDAHAKNYSVLLGPHGEAVLAPLYDVASGLAYSRPKERKRIAMSIGGENRVGRLSANHVETFANGNRLEAFGLDGKTCRALMAQTSDRIIEVLPDIFDSVADLPGADDLRMHMERPIVDLCKKTANAMSAKKT